MAIFLPFYTYIENRILSIFFLFLKKIDFVLNILNHFLENIDFIYISCS